MCHVYYPKGAASYVFEDSFLDYVESQLQKKTVRISIGAQPNENPHIGTIVLFASAFVLAKLLKAKNSDIECEVVFEMIDTAPATIEIINGNLYQTSLRNAGNPYYKDFIELLEFLSHYTGISYYVRGQREFNKSKWIPHIVSNITENSTKIKDYVCPGNGNLRIRVACPKCGRTDKHAVNTKIDKKNVVSVCPVHGRFSINIDKESHLLEYNTPLRNLIRTLLYMMESNDNGLDYCWIRMTGSDYAGFYQEQTLYKTVAMLGYDVTKIPCIIYTPLITDLYGTKVSKSMYVSDSRYLIEYYKLKNYSSIIKYYGNKGMDCILDIIEEWFVDPKKFFRNYSIKYFEEILENS